MNEKIIEEFEKLIMQIEKDIYDAKDTRDKRKHGFRLDNVKKALQTIKKLDFKIKKASDLEHLKGKKLGIGDHTLKRIEEILKKGKLSEIRDNGTQIKYAKRLEKIFGIGREKALDLVTKHNIKTVEDLIKKHKKGKIKLDSQIELGLKYYKNYDKNIPRSETDSINNFLQKVAKKIPGLVVTICGSYRRGKESSNDIDVLLYHKDVKTNKALQNKENYLNTYVERLTKKGFLLDTLAQGEKMYMGFSKLNENPVRRIDFIYVPFKSAYTALLHFTGSANHNTKLRSIAKTMGMKLNRYALIRDGKALPVKSEEDIFKYLKLEYLEPKYRI